MWQQRLVLPHSSFFFPPFIFISWRLVILQYCSGFCHTLTWISHGFTCVPHPDLLPPSPPHPSGSSQGTSPKHLSPASSLGWWSVSPLIVLTLSSSLIGINSMAKIWVVVETTVAGTSGCRGNRNLIGRLLSYYCSTDSGRNLAYLSI